MGLLLIKYSGYLVGFWYTLKRYRLWSFKSAVNLNKIACEQARFRAKYGTNEHLQIIKTIIDKTVYQRAMFHAFMNRL